MFGSGARIRATVVWIVVACAWFGISPASATTTTYDFTFTANSVAGSMSLIVDDSTLAVQAGSTITWNGQTGTLNTSGADVGDGGAHGTVPQLNSVAATPYFSSPTQTYLVFRIDATATNATYEVFSSGATDYMTTYNNNSQQQFGLQFSNESMSPAGAPGCCPGSSSAWAVSTPGDAFSSASFGRSLRSTG